MTKVTKNNHVVAGLDIGTTKVACVIGVMGIEGLNVVGVGVAPNPGMRQGTVVNIETTVEAIRKAREEAELMSGITLNSVWLGVGGMHIESFDSTGMVAIRNKEVSEEDIHRVIEAAKAVAIPTDRHVLHVVPQDYKIDGQEGISDPIGMSGVRLETSVHIITGNASSVQNAIKCTERAGLRVKGLVLQQLASALSVISEDEKDLGCSVVDIGGGTCDMISFTQGSVTHTAVIPVGGNNFTHDVAMGLRTTQNSAEALKKKYGCALAEMVNTDESIDVEAVGGRKSRTLPRRELCEVLEARAEETLHLIRGEIADADLTTKLGSGLILTGGGSLLPGLVEMGDFVFDIPVRRGAPDRVGGLTDVVRCSSFATAVGLVLYGVEQEKLKLKHKPVEAPRDSEEDGAVSGFAKKIKEYFSSVF
ncbi:MAG: cell division protein FtsA [Bdellovibrionaceae bacterium]|nr:cell division protein FtsA [Bdellovibrionales bacterium]MCB9084776.1 cell division protein FtsA [Pseudobdellovibrionaceae bacterium]